MILFKKIPEGKLNLDGSVEGMDKAPVAADLGMPTDEFHKQIMDLTNSKVPLDKALKAIDSHPDIVNKEAAKGMASAIYDIMGIKETKQNGA